jgi:hypothetical protein
MTIWHSTSMIYTELRFVFRIFSSTVLECALVGTLAQSLYFQRKQSK